MSARRVLIVLASIAVSALSLVLVLRLVPLDDLIQNLHKAEPAYLLLSVLSVAFALFTRGIRWWILLNRRISVMESFHLINVMFLGNQLPLRLGEVARGVLATRRGVPLVTSGTSIVVERLIDVLMLVILIAATVSRVPSAPGWLTGQASLLGALGLAGFLLLLILAHSPELAHRLLDRLLNTASPLKRFPLRKLLGQLLDGLQPLTDIRTLLYTALWTACAWFGALATLYFSHRALGIEVDYTISVPLGIALTALSIALPLSVAALGPFQLAILWTGQLVGMSDVEAISLAFFLHGINVLSYAVWGTIGLLALGASPAMAFASGAEDTDDSA